MNVWIDFLHGVLFLAGTFCLIAIIGVVTYVLISTLLFVGMYLNDKTRWPE